MCQKSRQKDRMGINGKFNENKTRMNSLLLHQFEDKTCGGWKKVQKLGFEILERESVHSL